MKRSDCNKLRLRWKRENAENEEVKVMYKDTVLKDEKAIVVGEKDERCQEEGDKNNDKK